MPTPRTGQITVTSTATPLTTDTTLVPAAFVVKAATGNAATVELVASGGTLGTGFQLDAGEEFIYTRDTRTGEPRFDLRPCDLYVVGASGTVSWFASAE